MKDMGNQSDIDRLRLLVGADDDDNARTRRIRALSDDELRDAARLVGNTKLFVAGPTLEAIEAEVRSRGLSASRN
jgi:hypothetical protein